MAPMWLGQGVGEMTPNITILKVKKKYLNGPQIKIRAAFKFLKYLTTFVGFNYFFKQGNITNYKGL